MSYQELLEQIVEDRSDIESMKSEIVSEFLLDENRVHDLLTENAGELVTYIRQYAEGISISGVRGFNLLTKRIMENARDEIDRIGWERADEKEYGGLL